MLDANQWIKDMQAQVAETQRKAEEMQAEITAMEVTVSSSDGAVTVSVAPNGAVRSIQLGHRACDLGHTRLTVQIMEMLQKAQREVSRKVMHCFEDTFPDDVESMKVMRRAIPFDLDEDDDFADRPW